MEGATKLTTAYLIGGIILLGASAILAAQLHGGAFLARKKRGKRKPVRVYMDGCFDMMHYGHCNALRQARALGDVLVVGVVSDDEITANKGPPVTPLHERIIMVGAVKWVDEILADASYAITEEFMHTTCSTKCPTHFFSQSQTETNSIFQPIFFSI